VRDESPPSGLSGDDQGDAPGTGTARRGDRRGPGPRHLASNGGPRPLDRSNGPTARARARSAAEADASPNGQGEPDRGNARSAPGAHKPARSLRRTVLEWVAVIGGGIVIALVVEAFLVQAFWIPSPSMVPTLEVGDRVLVNKLSYKFHDVHRGDVVVFERPPGASDGSDDEIKDLIKRVVGVGGDHLETRDGQLYVNREAVDEPYLEPGTLTNMPAAVTVPEGEVFVMGDNRENSEDSRVFGPIDEDTIVGRAFVKVLPLTDVGWL
jgi:signal peptidase I